MPYFVFIYIGVIIIFMILRIRKQRKASGQKGHPQPRPDSHNRQPGGARAGTQEAGRFRGQFPPDGPGAEVSGGEDDYFSGLLRRMRGEEPPARPDEAEGDEVVESAWRAFHPDEERDDPAVSRARTVSAVQPVPVKPLPPARAGGPAAEAAGEKPAKEKPAAGEKAAGEGSAAREEKAVRTALPESFSSRLSRLGPLQQALVMAEALGKPKALREENV
jgi:hypothetical protein